MAINNTDPTTVKLFTDLASLNSLKNKQGAEGEAALREVAQQFEQMFMNMMLKSMRQAGDVLGDDSLFNSSETRFFQDMLDQQVSMEMADKGKGFGLTDVIVRQLSQQNASRISAEQLANPDEATQKLLQQAYDAAASVTASAVLANAVSADQDAPANVESVQQNLEKALNRVANELDAADLPQRFESPKAFVEQLLPLAQRIAPELGVDPKVLLAQAALETGWGQKISRDQNSGQTSFNLFNIKADARWSGDAVQVQTLEYSNGIPAPQRAAFRAYGSYAESFRDYVDFLKGSSRYQLALEQADNPMSYLTELQAAGYATDPKYADKIGQILSGEFLAALNTDSSQG